MRRYPPPKATRWRDINGNRTGGKPGWAKLRKAALERDGHRCAWITHEGARCTTTTNLQVHHLHPGLEQVVPLEHLISLCRRHHPSSSTVW